MSRNNNNNTPATAGVEKEGLETTATEEVKAPADEVAKATAAETFTINGFEYCFSEDCPEQLQYNGVVYTKEKLVTNEDVLLALVVGESPFVKKV